MWPTRNCCAAGWSWWKACTPRWGEGRTDEMPVAGLREAAWIRAEGALLLTRNEVARLLSGAELTAAIEHAFRLLGEGKAAPPGVLGIPAVEGGFHIKAGLLDLETRYFAAKVNANV